MFDDPQTQAIKSVADVVALIQHHVVGQQLVEGAICQGKILLRFANGVALYFGGTQTLGIALPNTPPAKEPDGQPN